MISALKVATPLHRRGKSQLGLSDEWGTPTEFFRAWNKIYSFTLDVAASDKNARVPLYLTREQDGLSLPWGKHRCWMNPPYSRGELSRWTAKAKAEAMKGALVVGLIPASTDTAWWHDNVWRPTDAGVPHGNDWDWEILAFRQKWSSLWVSVHFVRGRLAFEHGGKAIDSARAPSVIVVWETGEAYR